MKQTIICIVGPSGCGKSTAAAWLDEYLGISSVASCTTRPQREDEINGVGHYFVSEQDMPSRSEMIAYTKFGNCHYWVSRQELPKERLFVYVIDEKGLLMLMEDHADEFDVVPVLVKRDVNKLVETVGNDRVNRDHNRIRIDERTYEYIIDNNGDLRTFCNSIIEVGLKIKSRYGYTY